ncbi:molybdopterin-guanine dinucleotide biosynthesis protein B [Enterococcus sp. 8G7_MSG3316]|uniref:cyclic pyranopterin monophosphate synthase n=1 Tax=Candidatus Enterococcus testudinis TaxID=1834191 RepID=A0A242A5U7_9ENTE|nr:molybdopterin-guanine dinucleotide biosynthesis protein B [Enterococcus sp. 8G7_MSG3316]
MVVALQIIGHKNSGKTTTMCHFIEKAQMLDLNVTACKSTHHQATMDFEGTDSYRFAEAGAHQVFLQNPTHVFFQGPISGSGNTIASKEVCGLADGNFRLSAFERYIAPDADILLLEGYKDAGLPKLILLKPGENKDHFSCSGQIIYASVYADVVKERNIVDLSDKQKAQTWFSAWLSENINEEDSLTHFNAQQRAKMVDVSMKKATSRVAVASCRLTMKTETIERIRNNQIKKGDVLAVAQVAGIMGAKQTSTLIPMCHLIALKSVDIHFEFNDNTSITIISTTKAIDQTGVEMEALVACQIAALTIYDMCKAIDPSIEITACHLLAKCGGKMNYHK